MFEHFLTLAELSAEEFSSLLSLAHEVKAHPERFAERLHRRVLATIFEKPSTRTRVSFEVAMYQLGGTALFLSSRDLQLGRGESIADTARVLSRYVDGIAARVMSHATLMDLAEHATVPVINALSDETHPCQALADYMTIQEVFGQDLKGKKLVFVGDANNVYRSLVFGALHLGVHVTLACPKEYQPPARFFEKLRPRAEAAGCRLEVTDEPAEAVQGAHVIYTDVWTSMGQEAEERARRRAFEPFQVNGALMAAAGPQARFMHCLPAHRGEEVTDEVADGPSSVIFDQAENRLHAQKALLLVLLGQEH